MPIEARANRILAGLPDDALAAVLAVSDVVPLTHRLLLETPQKPITDVVFPMSGVASVVLNRGEQKVEAGLIGREGGTGLPLLLGVGTTALECFVQLPGEGIRLPVQRYQELLDRYPALRSLMLRYLFEFHLQVAETALANARGSIEERLARWLLMTHDRTGDPTLNLTHAFLSQMLGVRRPGVTTALQSLEEARLIRSNRARIVVLDRAGLIERADELYGGPPPALLTPPT